MLFTSPVYSQASGSIAGLTYSHGRSGMIVKARRTPTNPNSARQRIIRHAVARLAPHWGQVLTNDQRDAWRLYAANVPMINALGQTIFLTALNHFARSNIIRIQIGAQIRDDAPTIFDLGTFTAPVLATAFEPTQTIIITFFPGDDWANETDSFLVGWSGRPVGPGHNFYRSPWRFGDSVEGDSPPPTSPLNVPAQWPITVGQNIWAYIRILRADGRVSLPVILGPIIVSS